MINTERLIKLAQVLDRRGRTTRNFLNMNTWLAQTQPADRTPCNTAGCALGVATAIPEFMEAGFVAVASYVGGAHIKYEERVGYGATSQFFNITYSEATHLFAPFAYENPSKVSPRTVASRIRRFVKKERT